MAKEASTLIRLPDVDEFVPSHSASGSRAYLHLNTDKASGCGIMSSAMVEFRNEAGDVAFAIGGAGGDFRVYLRHDRRARATQKAIDTQHAEVFTEEAVAVLLGAVREHYATRAKAA